MLDEDRIVAVSFHTAEELRMLKGSLKRVYSLPTDGTFDDLLRALDRESGQGSSNKPPR